MNLSIKYALEILGIESNFVTPKDIKKAYQKAAAKYHPDCNPAGSEMMKMVNVAYETVKDYEGTVTHSNNSKNYGEAVNTALNAIIHLGLTIEVCGSWVWVTGDTKPHRETLLTAGFKWSRQKVAWYYRPEDYKSHNRTVWSMDKIRKTYGSDKIQNEQKQLRAAY